MEEPQGENGVKASPDKILDVLRKTCSSLKTEHGHQWGTETTTSHAVDGETKDSKVQERGHHPTGYQGIRGDTAQFWEQEDSAHNHMN